MSSVEIEVDYSNAGIKDCLSSHGGAGFILGTIVRKDGKFVCPCGAVITMPESYKAPSYIIRE